MKAPGKKSDSRVWLVWSLVLTGIFCLQGRLQAQDAQYGIEKRIPWTTSKVQGSPDPALPYETERAFPQLKFNQPLVVATAPGMKRFFVAERWCRR